MNCIISPHKHTSCLPVKQVASFYQETVNKQQLVKLLLYFPFKKAQKWNSSQIGWLCCVMILEMYPNGTQGLFSCSHFKFSCNWSVFQEKGFRTAVSSGIHWKYSQIQRLASRSLTHFSALAAAVGAQFCHRMYTHPLKVTTGRLQFDLVTISFTLLRLCQPFLYKPLPSRIFCNNHKTH